MSRNENAINDVRRKISEVMKKDATRIQVGWTPPKVERKEGEEWIDNDGKKWTVKNGIKQSISKLETAKTPWFCPRCSKAMPHRLDTKMWRMRGFCMDCAWKEETEMKRLGTWEAFEKKKLTENLIDYLKDKLAELQDAHDNISAPEFIHADNEKILMIEKWDMDLDTVRKDMAEEIEKLKAHIDLVIEEAKKEGIL